jgi:hypothetical protein
MTEYLAENSRLRQLSRQYARGLLAQADYRAARHRILEALEAGQVEAGFIEPAVPLVEPEPVSAAESTAVFLKTVPPGQITATSTATTAEQAYDEASSEGLVEVSAEEEGLGAVSPFDGHSKVLAVVLLVLLLVVTGMLVYVFAL